MDLYGPCKRPGASVRTIKRLNTRSTAVAIGVTFEAAILIGIRLFRAEGLEP